jgi:hypothetical protein
VVSLSNHQGKRLIAPQQAGQELAAVRPAGFNGQISQQCPRLPSLHSGQVVGSEHADRSILRQAVVVSLSNHQDKHPMSPRTGRAAKGGVGS